MSDLSIYQAKREKLRQMYLETSGTRSGTGNVALTGGVDHLAMISSDIERTIEFYTNVLGMRVANIIQNRDEPSSTHIFLDMGGGNLMAFFDFPQHGDAPAVRGIGAMHHVALKAEPTQYKALFGRLREQDIDFSLEGTEESGSVYMRDLDNALIEVTCR